MRKLQTLSILFFLLPVLLSGSVSPGLHRIDGPLHTVTTVHVVCSRENRTMTRLYHAPRKMEKVLNYLRLLEDQGTADTDPERLAGDRFEITLYYSDGQQGIYRQRGDRYLSKNAHPWKKVDPDQARLLYPMLQAMPSDRKQI